MKTWDAYIELKKTIDDIDRKIPLLEQLSSRAVQVSASSASLVGVRLHLCLSRLGLDCGLQTRARQLTAWVALVNTPHEYTRTPTHTRTLTLTLALTLSHPHRTVTGTRSPR